MQEERTPVEARSGVISGRVTPVLISSFAGVVISFGLRRALLIRA